MTGSWSHNCKLTGCCRQSSELCKTSLMIFGGLTGVSPQQVPIGVTCFQPRWGGGETCGNTAVGLMSSTESSWWLLAVSFGQFFADSVVLYCSWGGDLLVFGEEKQYLQRRVLDLERWARSGCPGRPSPPAVLWLSSGQL